jgi:hypothetical protein
MEQFLVRFSVSCLFLLVFVNVRFPTLGVGDRFLELIRVGVKSVSNNHQVPKFGHSGSASQSWVNRNSIKIVVAFFVHERDIILQSGFCQI